MQNYTQAQSPATPVQPNQLSNDGGLLVASLAVTFAVLPLFGMVAYKKYRVILRQRQIKALERAWQLSPKEKKF